MQESPGARLLLDDDIAIVESTRLLFLAADAQTKERTQQQAGIGNALSLKWKDDGVQRPSPRLHYRHSTHASLYRPVENSQSKAATNTAHHVCRRL